MIVPMYKQKGDPPECGNFRGVKLLAVVTDKEEEMHRRWLGWQIETESKGLKSIPVKQK